MPSYQQVIDNISAQTRTTFRPASQEGLSALRALRVPKPIVDFFALHEPSDCAEGQVRLWPIADILQENRDLVPGAYIAPLGYIVFATTFCGDTYCLDLNNIANDGEPRIVLLSHEVVEEEFLDKFTREEIDEDCIY